MNYLRFLLAFTATLGCASLLVIASDSEDLRERFIQEAPEGWQKLSRILLHGQGQIHLSSKNYSPNSNPTNAYEEDVVFMINGENHRRVEAIDKQSKRVSIGCRNPSQSFWLKGTQNISGYRIDILRKDNDETWSDNRMANDHMWRVAPLIYTPFAIRDIELIHIISSEQFSLKSVRSASGDSGEVEVSFRYVTPQGIPWDVIMTVDPSNSWAVTHYSMEQPFGKNILTFDCTVKYGEMSPDLTIRPPISAVEIVGEKKEIASGTYLQHEFELVNFKVEDIPKQEFTLEAFDLTESRNGLVSSQWRIWSLITINAGVLLFLLGLWIIKRKSSSPPTDNRNL